MSTPEPTLGGGSPPAKQKRKKYTVSPRRKMAATIRKAQQGTNLLIPKAPFARLVRELVAAHTFGPHPLRVGADALEALQSVSETHLTELLQKTQAIAERSGQKTAMPLHFQAAVGASS